ncbi:MAG TPA: ABC transporter substrate-binding protein [Vicinamibacterales bacterium]|nr:ABC transporter substrate-binding protein [Vicinamibacterales bacterium]
MKPVAWSCVILLIAVTDVVNAQTTVRVGYLPATHDTLLFIALEERLFSAQIAVDPRQYKASPDILKDLAAQHIDLGIPGIAAPVNFISSGQPFSIVGGAAAESAAVVVPTARAAQFLGKSLSAKMAAFRGLRVGTVRQSTGDALFRKAVRDAGLVTVVNIREYADPNALLAELRSQFIDAAVLWSPHMSRAEEGTSPMKIVMWMDEVLPSHVCCRQVVHDGFLASRRQAVVHYLAGIIRAMKFYQEPKNKERILAIAAKWIPGNSPAILEKELYIADADHHNHPRTTLSADLNMDGISTYVSAMAKTTGLNSSKTGPVLAKVDRRALVEAYRTLGLSASEAERCVSQGFSRCDTASIR